MSASVYTIIIVVLVLVIVGLILALVFSQRQRAKLSKKYQDKFGPDYDATVKTMGNETKAQKEMDNRQKHVDSLDIRSLTLNEREKYLSEWKAVQAKFIDQPGPATVEADHLIMEVMQLRNYPVSNFEQRAADISINYPELVTNYRLARAIAIKNEQHEADTEELRQALVHYRALFNELLITEEVVPEKA
jgi:cytoskeletal protein RodZ